MGSMIKIGVATDYYAIKEKAKATAAAEALESARNSNSTNATDIIAELEANPFNYTNMRIQVYTYTYIYAFLSE